MFLVRSSRDANEQVFISVQLEDPSYKLPLDVRHVNYASNTWFYSMDSETMSHLQLAQTATQ